MAHPWSAVIPIEQDIDLPDCDFRSLVFLLFFEGVIPVGKEADKSLFFLIMSMACIWLILDQAFGAKRLQGFLAMLFPFMSDSSSSGTAMTSEQYEKAVETAPESSAIGSDESPKEKQMKADNATLYDYWKNNKIPYAPALQAQLEAYKKKWGVS